MSGNNHTTIRTYDIYRVSRYLPYDRGDFLAEPVRVSATSRRKAAEWLAREMGLPYREGSYIVYEPEGEYMWWVDMSHSGQ